MAVAHARVARAMAAQRERRSRFVQFWASGGAKLPKMGDSLPRMPMNHSAKFDAASFIVGGEICNRTNKQTVNDISTPCLLACVDDKEMLMYCVKRERERERLMNVCRSWKTRSNYIGEKCWS